MTQLYTDPFGPPWRFKWLRLIAQWRGGIFQFFWVEWFLATAVCAVVLTILYFSRKDANQDALEATFEGFADVVYFLTTRFQSALSLMLGFYTSTIYGRWWKVRDVEGVVLGRINDIAVQIAGMVRDEPFLTQDEDQTSDEIEPEESPGNKKSHIRPATVADVRMHLIRWLNLAHALAVGELYEKKPNEFCSLERLRDFGLATDREYEFLQDQTRSRYVAPFVWFTDLVMELKDKNLCGISEGSLQVFANNITRIRGSLADLYMYRNIPVPIAYRQLVNITVRGYMFIVLFSSSMRDLEKEENYGGLTEGAFWIILSFAFEYFLFVGWLSLADALGNPFRVWADEFEWENYVKSLILSSSLIGTGFRQGSMSLDDTRKSGEEVREKLNAICSKWETPEEVGTDRPLREARKYFTGF